ncbi:Uncharacterized protein conserved in bacteria (DUF2313) [Leminorella grimontii]|uniref:YmfQ family protein n=1 Tax=Leminorella grimontii TaxID=82981 RepID=UPI0010B09DE4|nr:putative phage tail protein [Leminorella grimontii]VFS62685.1 Uncharacterized protein conserved in bacteria (DUF2313) [Leminorella grimontii]
MLGLGDELARIDAVGDRLLNEMFADNAFMLLSDWEAFAEAYPIVRPDNDLTIDNRRLALAAKLKMTGTLCTKFFEQLAADRGYSIQIRDHYPHHCLRPCTYPLYPESNWWTAYVYVGAPFLHNMTVLDGVTTRLKVYDYGDLECLLDRYRPAHIHFVYIF